MPNTPLDPDALWKKIDTFCENMAETGQMDRMEAIDLLHEAQNHLAVAQPVVNSVEELDALPINSVILDRFDYLHHKYAQSMPDFKNLVTGGHITRLESYLPARVLWSPSVNDA